MKNHLHIQSAELILTAFVCRQIGKYCVNNLRNELQCIYRFSGCSFFFNSNRHNHFEAYFRITLCIHICCSFIVLLYRLNGFGKKGTLFHIFSTVNGKSRFYNNNLQVNKQTRALTHTHTHTAPKLRPIQFVVIEQQFRGIKMTYYKFIS